MLKAEDLLGTWTLVLWRVDYSDGRESSYPFGHDGGGMIMYTPDGYMSAVLHSSKRGPVSTQYVREAPDAERALFPAGFSPRQLDDGRIAEAYWSYFHYAGTWRIEGDSVIHTVQHSLNPAMVGTEQVRHVKFEDEFLILSGEEKVPGTDLERLHVVRWKRP